MSEPIRLHVVSPARSVIDERVTEVTGPGVLGQFGILPDHAAYLTALDAGILTYVTRGIRRDIAVRGGFAEVSENTVVVLADEALPAEAVDAAEAESDLREAEARLPKLDPFSAEHEKEEQRRRWAQVRLEVAARRDRGSA